MTNAQSLGPEIARLATAYNNEMQTLNETQQAQHEERTIQQDVDASQNRLRKTIESLAEAGLQREGAFQKFLTSLTDEETRMQDSRGRVKELAAAEQRSKKAMLDLKQEFAVVKQAMQE